MEPNLLNTIDITTVHTPSLLINTIVGNILIEFFHLTGQEKLCDIQHFLFVQLAQSFH